MKINQLGLNDADFIEIEKIPQARILAVMASISLQNRGLSRPFPFPEFLTAENETGDMYLRRELYSLLDRCGEDYAALLDGHIGRHLKALLG